jgi:hypothetical protein
MTTSIALTVPYPRRRVLRAVMHTLAQHAFGALAIWIIGRENMPAQGR